MHVKMVEELYQTSWRSAPVESVPFPNQIPPAPEPSESVKEWEKTQKKPTTGVKLAGAYRPPGARGLATPAIFKREDEGGLPSRNGSPAGSGANTPVRGYSRSPAPPGAPGYGQYANGDGSKHGKRHVPGAPPPAAASPGGENDRKGNRKKKGGKNKDSTGGGAGESGTVDGAQANGSSNTPRGKKGGQHQQPQREEIVPAAAPPTPTPEIIEPVSPISPGTDAALDTVAKRVRNLNKKVRQSFALLSYQTDGTDTVKSH